MNFKSKEFKELRAEWYEKLKQAGFKDIEKNDAELQEPSKILPFTYEETVKYYSRLREHLETGEFDNWLERVIFYMYTEGASSTEIVNILGKDSSMVSRIISKHERKAVNRR